MRTMTTHELDQVAAGTKEYSRIFISTEIPLSQLLPYIVNAQNATELTDEQTTLFTIGNNMLQNGVDPTFKFHLYYESKD